MRLTKLSRTLLTHRLCHNYRLPRLLLPPRQAMVPWRNTSPESRPPRHFVYARVCDLERRTTTRLSRRRSRCIETTLRFSNNLGRQCSRLKRLDVVCKMIQTPRPDDRCTVIWMRNRISQHESISIVLPGQLVKIRFLPQRLPVRIAIDPCILLLDSVPG